MNSTNSVKLLFIFVLCLGPSSAYIVKRFKFAQVFNFTNNNIMVMKIIFLFNFLQASECYFNFNGVVECKISDNCTVLYPSGIEMCYQFATGGNPVSSTLNNQDLGRLENLPPWILERFRFYRYNFRRNSINFNSFWIKIISKMDVNSEIYYIFIFLL